jgi:hypothetical protein
MLARRNGSASVKIKRLMAISGKGDANAKGAAKETKRPARQRKAGQCLCDRRQKKRVSA